MICYVLQVSHSIHHMMKVLLPCGKMEYAPYALENKPFTFYDGRCCYGKCPKHMLAAKARLLGSEPPQVCGWSNVFGNDFCPFEATDQPFTWKVCIPIGFIYRESVHLHYRRLFPHAGMGATVAWHKFRRGTFLLT